MRDAYVSARMYVCMCVHVCARIRIGRCASRGDKTFLRVSSVLVARRDVISLAVSEETRAFRFVEPSRAACRDGDARYLVIGAERVENCHPR